MMLQRAYPVLCRVSRWLLVPLLACTVLTPLLLAGIGISQSAYCGNLTVAFRGIAPAADGSACLSSRAEASNETWTIGAPTLFSNTGRQFLSYGLDQKVPAVRMTDKWSRGAEWVIEVVGRFEPKEYENKGPKGARFLREGHEGYDFILSAKNGPYAGWYLSAAGPADKANSPQPLVLVKDRKQAAQLHYVQRRHWIR